MKTRKNFKLRKSLPLAILMPLTSMVPLTSCGIFNVKEWDFKESSKDITEINYCLLIGQNDHSDSIERTRYTRKALGTLDETEETKVRTKDNPNIAQPINGQEHEFDYDGGKKKLVVNEIEHMEQKSLSGATWDAITANSTAETWIAKHGSKITFFVSNNDGMAEGAYWACNWIKGLPIFGYDANSTTIEKIYAGRITGTVDQNASSQCGAMTMMMRNMLEDRDAYWSGNIAEAHGFGKEDYNPIYYKDDGGNNVYRGFHNPSAPTEPWVDKYGYVDRTYITDNSEYEHIAGETRARDVLIKSTFIDKDNVSGEHGYIKDDGTAKEPKDMVDDIFQINKVAQTKTQYKVCQTYASQSEAYLIATMRPYVVEYANRLNLDLTMIEGDGTDESVIINKLDALQVPTDGYLINMVKTSATTSYIEPLARKAFAFEVSKGKKTGTLPANGWDKFEDRLDTPVIFWNRQPHTQAGGIDKEVMNNKFFKYVYFVGVDNQVGGQAQGDGIVKHIGQWLTKYLNKR